MKKQIFSFMLTVLCVLLYPQGVEARSAVLVAHYGSSDNETRAATIDLITADIRAALPHTEVREAYISPVVRRNLESRGISADSPTQALLKLCTEGYDTVYVQSTTIIDGAEMAEVRSAVHATRHFFKKVVTGRPLCFSPEDCLQLVEVLGQESHKKGEAVVYVGHGNNLSSTATYCQLDYMMHQCGMEGYHVSTIEGYPTALTALAELKADKSIKSVKLVPLLLVCGNHTKRDIAGDFATVLTKAGYSTFTLMRGLAEIPAIRAIYVQRVLQLINS